MGASGRHAGLADPDGGPRSPDPLGGRPRRCSDPLRRRRFPTRRPSPARSRRRSRTLGRSPPCRSTRARRPALQEGLRATCCGIAARKRRPLDAKQRRRLPTAGSPAAFRGQVVGLAGTQSRRSSPTRLAPPTSTSTCGSTRPPARLEGRCASTSCRRRSSVSVAVSAPLAGVHADGRPVTLGEHLHLHGPLPGRLDRGSLLDAVERSGLRGRGGAGFPTALKLRAVAGRRGRRSSRERRRGRAGERKGQGAPPSRAAPRPRRCRFAADAVGARQAILASLTGRDRRARRARAALRERGRRRPRRDQDRGRSGHVRRRRGDRAHQRRRRRPAASRRSKPPRPFERGVGGRPTLVQNVETLAQLALIARTAPPGSASSARATSRAARSSPSPARSRPPGVYEVPLGTPLRDLVAARRRADASRHAACSSAATSGPGSTPAPRLPATLSEASLAAAGALLGARAIVVLPEGSCALAEVARVSRFLADESAGQCGPCVHGLAMP